MAAMKEPIICELHNYATRGGYPCPECIAAAGAKDRIAELEAENTRLREALILAGWVISEDGTMHCSGCGNTEGHGSKCVFAKVLEAKP